MQSHKIRRVEVRRRPGLRGEGLLMAGPLICRCAIGRGGLVARKREGDGGTPLGRWPLRYGYYRADRMRRPPAPGVQLIPLAPDFGWCDAPGDRNYNRFVRHPYPASAEHLWREDRLYDSVIVIGYNDRVRRRGAGSAIFLHVAEAGACGGLKPTQGCIALRPGDLRRLLLLLGPRATVFIGQGVGRRIAAI